MGLGPVQSHRASHSKGLHTCCHCLQMFNFLSKGLFIFTSTGPRDYVAGPEREGGEGEGE